MYPIFQMEDFLVSTDNPVYVKHAFDKSDLKHINTLIAATEARTNLLNTVFALLRLNAEVDDETTPILLEEYAPPLKDSLNQMDALIAELGAPIFHTIEDECEEEGED